jgi:dTMP kinase|tara:strand:- start:122 stop:733 length:612 start_codon:yes stop_codon:yes gene_type:complete
MSKKPVIVFEGIEGSGKSHHILNVSKYLKENKIDFIKLREPGGNPNSEKIRKLILNKNSNFNKITDLLLYLAARSENIQLLKKYYKKKVILIDRFIDSTIAYQHYGFNVDLKFINFINNYLLNDFKVDYTFLNTVNKTNMINRLKLRKSLNRYDKFNIKFYEKVQKGFLKLANKNKKKYMIINSNLDINNNQDQVISAIKKIT